MNSQDNEPEMRTVVVLLVTVILLVVSFVVGLSIHKAKPKGEPALPMVLASVPEKATEPLNDSRVVVAPGIVKFYFASGKADLAVGTQEALATAVLAAKSGQKLTISGFHDATGSPTMNANLAKQRALSVRSALLVAGVDEALLEVKKPEQMPRDTNLAEARRVEVVIQP